MADTPDKKSSKAGRKKSDFKFSRMEKDLILSMFREGKIRTEIVAALGGAMKLRWFDELVKRDPEFQQECRDAKQEADDKVVRSLYRRCVGFEFEEKERDNRGNTKIKTRYVYPDPQACQFWLCNRRPGEWRMVTHIQQTQLNVPAELQEKSSTELARILIENERHHINSQRPGPAGDNQADNK